MKERLLLRKFREDISILDDAVDGVVNLEDDYPHLYKKLYEFYDVNGLQLFGDPDDDYEVVLTELERDLTNLMDPAMISEF
jgi:hypothetical protein